jgi:hypothetical protein
MRLAATGRIASPRRALALALGAAALLAAAAPPSEADASCGALSISPSSQKVRAGGRLTLNGSCSSATAASATGSPSSAVIQVKGRRGWQPAARVVMATDGTFSTPLRIQVPQNVPIATIRAQGSDFPPAATRVGVFPACKSVPKCRKRFGKKKRAAASGLLANDTAAVANPNSIWGATDCETASRHQQITSGGDSQPTATGVPQGNSSFRRLTVLDGDDYWGERCELGRNDNEGPVAFYHEGQRRITYASFRLPPNYPLYTDMWQGVLQMKQAQPADNGGGTPVLSLGAYDGKWMLFHSAAGPTDTDAVIWEAPATGNRWTRIMIDAVYSQSASKGRLTMSIDLDGDGSFGAGETTKTFQMNTLKYETAGDNSDGLTPGESIPSHLRVGMYHHPSIPCPSGCSVDVDNVQVLAP